MDVMELSVRLRKLGLTKIDLASYLGVGSGTVYHWKETPKYIERVVELMEKVAALGGKAI